MTLGIIGVVAAMTIPVLMTKFRKIVVVNKLKQTVSMIHQTVRMAEANEEPLDTLHLWDTQSYKYGAVTYGNYGRGVIPELSKRMAGSIVYPPATSRATAMCYTQNKEYPAYKYLSGNTSASDAFTPGCTVSMSLPNGACIGYNGWSGCGSSTNVMFIDVDGPYSGENTWGKDVYLYHFDEIDNSHSGVITNGKGIGGIYFMPKVPYQKSYNTTTRSEFEQGCSKKVWNSGWGCSALILQDGWAINYDW